MVQASDDTSTSEDDVVVPLRPDQARPKDPTGAERQARFRENHRRNGKGKRKKNNKKRVDGARTVTPAPVFADAPPIAPTVTQLDATEGVTLPARPAPLAPVTGVQVSATRAGIDVAAYTAAVALAGAAAFFSIKGMVVLFPGASLAVVVMAIAMEAAKLITAGWLARRWRATAKLWRAALVAFVFGLAIINAAGVYAQLVSAHVGERGAAQSDIEMKDAVLAAKLESQIHIVADFDRRVGQIDVTIEEAAKRGRTNAAISVMEGQKRARTALVEERNREAGTLAALKAERAAVAAQGKRIETEAAPIRYVAELLGIDTDSEKAIRWLIALMVLCCDPLAIALTAAASARRSTTV
jgi:hypothetical protein